MMSKQLFRVNIHFRWLGRNIVTARNIMANS